MVSSAAERSRRMTPRGTTPHAPVPRGKENPPKSPAETPSAGDSSVCCAISPADGAGEAAPELAYHFPPFLPLAPAAERWVWRESGYLSYCVGIASCCPGVTTAEDSPLRSTSSAITSRGSALGAIRDATDHSESPDCTVA